jgi:hypothetical protein
MSKKSPQASNINITRLTPMEWGLIILVTMVSTLTVIVSIDPARRLNEASNAERFSDISLILDELLDYKHEESEFPAVISILEPEHAYEIGLCSEDAYCDALTVQESCVDLSQFKNIPYDPEKGDIEHSSYYVIAHENGEVTVGVCSPNAEGAAGDGAIPSINLRD